MTVTYCGAETIATEPKYPLLRPNATTKNIGKTSLLNTTGIDPRERLQSRKRGMKTNLNTERIRRRKRGLPPI